MRKFKIEHMSVGPFSEGQTVTADQIAAAAKVHSAHFDVEEWLAAKAVTEVVEQPPAEEKKASEAAKQPQLAAAATSGTRPANPPPVHQVGEASKTGAAS